MAAAIQVNLSAQDTITVPLRIKAGIDIAGPVIYASGKKILNTEAFLSADLSEKKAVYLSAGFLDYKYSQYNYEYTNRGAFVKAGLDFNLLKPEKAADRYWAGIGLRYGITVFNSEFPSFSQDNYWGTNISAIPRNTHWAHFIEVSPGIRTGLFRNISMGWNISMRMLIYSGTGKDLKPIYLPGFGNAQKNVTAGVSYYLVWSIPYKKIRVILKKEVPEEPDDTQGSNTNSNNNNRQQSQSIRQQ